MTKQIFVPVFTALALILSACNANNTSGSGSTSNPTFSPTPTPAPVQTANVTSQGLVGTWHTSNTSFIINADGTLTSQLYMVMPGMGLFPMGSASGSITDLTASNTCPSSDLCGSMNVVLSTVTGPYSAPASTYSCTYDVTPASTGVVANFALDCGQNLTGSFSVGPVPVPVTPQCPAGYVGTFPNCFSISPI